MIDAVSTATGDDGTSVVQQQEVADAARSDSKDQTDLISIKVSGGPWCYGSGPLKSLHDL
jgi:hypothetical protein